MKPLSRFMISMLEAARRSPIGQVSGFGYGDGIHSIVTGRALIARGLFDSQTVRGGNEQKFTLTVEGRAAIEHFWDDANGVALHVGDEVRGLYPNEAITHAVISRLVMDPEAKRFEARLDDGRIVFMNPEWTAKVLA